MWTHLKLCLHLCRSLSRSFSILVRTKFQFAEVYFLSRLIRAIHGSCTVGKESLGLVAIRIGICNHDPLKNSQAADAYGAPNRRTQLSSTFLFDFLVSWRGV